MSTLSLSRRGLLAGAAGATAVGVGALVLPGNTAAADTAPASRKVILVGANPGIQLFDGDTCTAYASCWRVDWSTHGSGTALIVWYDDQVHLIGRDEQLYGVATKAGWSAEELRKIGFDEPAKSRRATRRKRSSAVHSTSGTNRSNDSEAATQA